MAAIGIQRQFSDAGSAAEGSGRYGTGLVDEPTIGAAPTIYSAVGADGVLRATAEARVGVSSAVPVDWRLEQRRQSLQLISSVAAPRRNDEIYYRVCCQLRRHLRDPHKPLVVVTADAPDDERLRQAVAAYGASEPLRNAADLVLVVTGSPPPNDEKSAEGADCERTTDRSTQAKQLLLEIDRYDLYGNVAVYYPRQPIDEVTELLRIARDRRGVLLVGDAAFELLSCDIGVPVVDADAEDLADLCGSMLVDPETWAELSRESQQTAAERRWQIGRSGGSALGRRLLESRRRRNGRVSSGRVLLAMTEADAGSTATAAAG